MVPRKREILVRLIRAFISGQDFPEDVQRISDEFGTDQRERSICRALAMSAMGLPLEGDGGELPLNQCARRSLERENVVSPPLTVLRCACNGCESSRIRVTDLCQNCVDKPCIASCKFGAIGNDGTRSVIDVKKCKKCSACVRACPYGAIVKTIVPCENVCPVGAIGKDEEGRATIDFSKCISCGKCIAACPFETIQPRSQVIDVLKAIKSKRKVIALAAPALFGQFSCSAGKLHAAIKKIGFALVYEVAIGAELTSLHEAKDLEERLGRGEKFMTTSCCAAYGGLVKKHIPELKPFVSTAGTPLFYTAKYVKKEHADGVLVFISPCLAKYEEVFANEDVDYVLNFEEIGALFDALSIVAGECAEENFDYETAKEAREFALSGGVSRAIQSAHGDGGAKVQFAAINGIDREAVKDLKRFAQAGECDGGNVLEVMSCPGGCVGGGLACCPVAAATRCVKSYGEKGPPLADRAKEDSPPKEENNS
ncbi:MAG: 4Fe-4S binding protein [Puniceicoccales bacterium]|jgi:[FeFe] hydrogenase (group B1/B3)|nr:4Fe-4S binding protein [Puniceicoccales bacterium]